MFKYGLVESGQTVENKVLLGAFKALEGQRTKGPDWDLLWYFGKEPPADLYKNISTERRISHVPGIAAIAHKWHLFNNLKHHWERVGLDQKHDQIHRFFPDAWLLPEDNKELSSLLQQQPDKSLILKPLKSSMGRGIELLQREDQLPDYGKWLAQEYIENPHLINNRKYTLRLFLLITSAAPLTAYLYRDGVVDLAVQPYSTDKNKRHNPAIHIANGALQSTFPEFDVKKHCMDLGQWRTHVTKNDNAEQVWKDIEAILKETLIAISAPLRESSMSQLAHPEQCFELLGVDIMLDSELKPWLIECNRTPSMTTEYSGDLKPNLLKDTLGLVLDRRQLLIDTPDGKPAPQPVSNFGGYKRII
ncbi:MAG: hypothetical protein KAJ95_10545 [Gammaproteobacteria bacterium]|nr:hypothetical protein [Gammaproteobacteria bacterium]